MFNNLMPLYYHPTRIILVDDNQHFLETLASALKKEGLDCITFNDPLAALNYINASPVYNRLNRVLHYIADDNSYFRRDTRLSIKMGDIFELLDSHPERVEDLSVLIMDYDMPEMKGDEFASLVSHKYLKKLMLTGQADYQAAINLLNENIIDNFAVKKPLEGVANILKQIKKLQMEYFSHLSQGVFESALAQSEIIQGSAYQSLLASTLKEEQIQEYYIFSPNGSALLINQQGAKIWLIIAEEEDLEGWSETAELADAPAEVVGPLVRREKLLFLFDEQEMDLSPSEWFKHLYAAHKVLGGNRSFYYALVTKKESCSMPHE